MRRSQRVPGLVLLVVLVTATALVVQLARRARRADVPPAPTCTGGPTTPGIDVSYHQDRIDWLKVRRAGVEFAFIRVSDGLTVDDPMFAANWSAARDALIVRGAYQYFRPEESATAQADRLLAALAHDRGELPPAIDVEETGGLRPEQVAIGVRTWVDRVRSRLGVEPIVYTSPAFWRDAVGADDLGIQPLWLAHYTDECPRIPAPWTAWQFWQRSKIGRVPGIRGDVDLNVFAGPPAQLRSVGTRR